MHVQVETESNRDLAVRQRETARYMPVQANMEGAVPGPGGAMMPISESCISEITEDTELAAHVREAVRISREHVAKGGIPFSGVVVNGGRVLGTGFNRVREDRDATAHAEVVALRAAAAKYGLHAVVGATLIASGEPCALCYLASRYFNIGHIVYAADRGTAARYGFD